MPSLAKTTPESSLFAHDSYPPGCNCAPEVENAFLRWAIGSQETITAFSSLPPEAFFQPQARKLWELIQAGYGDLAALMAVLPAKDHRYLLEVVELSLFGVDVAGWAKRIVDLYTQREIYRVASEAITLSRQRVADPALAIQQLITALGEIATVSRSDDTLKSHSQAAEDLLTEIAEAHSKQQQSDRYYWGWRALDDLTGGICPGQLITIGARSSMGKSTFALNAAENMAAAGIPTLFISLEMTISELEVKIFGRSARVAGTEFRDPLKMQEHTYARLIGFAERSAGLPLYLDDGSVRSANDIEATILRVSNIYGVKPKVVFIDYLQLMSLDGGATNMNQAVGLLTRSLKQLAKRLGVAIVILSQLNRGVEGKADKRPMMNDLRDSGSIEQDSNQVLMLYRDAYYNPASEMGDTTEVLVVKNRGGATGKAELVFDGQYSEFKGKL